MYQKLISPFHSLKDIALLAMRLVLAYGFYEPASKKIGHIADISSWFSSLGIPFPTLSAYLATITEITGVILLTLGLFTRLISIPLIITMLVAITTVHLSHGFSASNNGFEIPLYYMIMLLTIMSIGAGKISIDFWLQNKNK